MIKSISNKPIPCNIFAKSPQKPAYETDYLITKAKTELYPRRDHLIRQFARLGLKARQLATPELISLFYNAYNPEASTYVFQQKQAEESQEKAPVQAKPEINLPNKILNT